MTSNSSSLPPGFQTFDNSIKDENNNNILSKNTGNINNYSNILEKDIFSSSSSSRPGPTSTFRPTFLGATDSSFNNSQNTVISTAQSIDSTLSSHSNNSNNNFLSEIGTPLSINGTPRSNVSVHEHDHDDNTNGFNQQQQQQQQQHIMMMQNMSNNNNNFRQNFDNNNIDGSLLLPMGGGMNNNNNYRNNNNNTVGNNNGLFNNNNNNSNIAPLPTSNNNNNYSTMNNNPSSFIPPLPNNNNSFIPPLPSQPFNNLMNNNQPYSNNMNNNNQTNNFPMNNTITSNYSNNNNIMDPLTKSLIALDLTNNNNNNRMFPNNNNTINNPIVQNNNNKNNRFHNNNNDMIMMKQPIVNPITMHQQSHYYTSSHISSFNHNTGSHDSVPVPGPDPLAYLRLNLRVDCTAIAEGKETRTTIMIRNIPSRYTQQLLVDELVTSGFRGCFDFIYLPIDFRNGCSMGYSFANFMHPQDVIHFFTRWNGRRWPQFSSRKRCELAFARIQGKQALIEHFQHSRTLLASPANCRPIVFTSSGPHRGEIEPFPFRVTPNDNSAMNLNNNGNMGMFDDPALDFTSDFTMNNNNMNNNSNINNRNNMMSQHSMGNSIMMGNNNMNVPLNASNGWNNSTDNNTMPNNDLYSRSNNNQMNNNNNGNGINNSSVYGNSSIAMNNTNSNNNNNLMKNNLNISTNYNTSSLNGVTDMFTLSQFSNNSNNNKNNNNNNNNNVWSNPMA